MEADAAMCVKEKFLGAFLFRRTLNGSVICSEIQRLGA
jgi:hypothetical protein